MAKKGDIVAVKEVDRVHFIDPPRTVEKTQWRLAQCQSATRDGQAKAFSFPAESFARKVAHAAPSTRFFLIEGERQANAQRLFAELAANYQDYRVWETQEALRDAILCA